MEGFRLVSKNSSSIFPKNNYSTEKEANYVVRGDLEENMTFYYSNFKLFHEEAEIMFSKYIAFKQDLENLLGEEWHDYASKCVCKTSEGHKVNATSQEIFNVALELWLELRKNFKVVPDVKSQSNTAPITPREGNLVEEKESIEESKMEEISPLTPVETNPEENKFLETFQLKLREKFSSHEILDANFKAIIQAFYVSASKIWKEMILSYFGDPNKNEGFLIESKKFLLNKLSTFYHTKSKMLKPILVATKRIKDYVMDPNKKIFEGASLFKFPDERDLKNLNNFSSNIQTEAPSTPSNDSIPDEEHDLKRSFKNLQINTNNRGSFLGKRSAQQAYSTVEIKKSSKKFEKYLNPNTVEFAAHYVNNMVKTSNLDWQISRNFVTNMIEVNYNKLVQLENQINNKAQSINNDIRIRFIQPAQDFYNRLMEIWIIFKLHSKNNKEILFTEYLDKVKSSLGNLWSEQLIAAAQNFFMTLYYEWNKLKQNETNSEEKILHFIKKVKENMLKIWEENVVKKAEELSNKTLGTR